MGCLRNWVDRFLFKHGYRKYYPPEPTPTVFTHTFTRVEGSLFVCAEYGEGMRHPSMRDKIVYPCFSDPHPRYPAGSVVRLTDPIEVRCTDDRNTFVIIKPGDWRGVF